MFFVGTKEKLKEFVEKQKLMRTFVIKIYEDKNPNCLHSKHSYGFPAPLLDNKYSKEVYLLPISNITKNTKISTGTSYRIC